MTSRNNQPLAMPATVRDYLSKPAIRTGVDALLGVKPNMLPPDLQHKELGDYYAARAAAELVRFDWAAVLLDLWKKTWGAVLHKNWIPQPLAAHVKEDYAVTPAACWEQDAICFVHKIGSHHLATAVSIDSHEAVLAFWYQFGGNNPLADFDKFVSKKNDEWEDMWLVQRFEGAPTGPEFSLAKLRAAAKLAAAHADTLAGIKP